MRVIGIDPGTALMGFGVIDTADIPDLIDFGVIETGSDMSMPLRLKSLHESVNELLEHFRPDAMAIEQLFFARNVTTAITVGQARGVAILGAAMADVTVYEYSPSQIKHAISGYGKADKQQMQEMVRIMLGMTYIPQPDDAADALAVALCHAQRANFAKLISGDVE